MRCFSSSVIAAFLIPMAALWLGIEWFRSRPVESQKATLLGYSLLLLFLPSLFTYRFTSLTFAAPFLLEGWLARCCRRADSGVSTKPGHEVIVTLALLVTATFDHNVFVRASACVGERSPKGPIGAMDKLGMLQRVQARWHDWRERREQERMRRRVREANRLGRGGKPIKAAGRQFSGVADEKSPRENHSFERRKRHFRRGKGRTKDADEEEDDHTRKKARATRRRSSFEPGEAGQGREEVSRCRRLPRRQHKLQVASGKSAARRRALRRNWMKKN